MNSINKKLDILIIAYIIPYPTDDGGKICTFSFIDKLRDLNNFTVIFTLYSEQDELNVGVLQSMWKNVKIKTIKLFDHNEDQQPANLMHKLKQGVKQIFDYVSTSKINAQPVYDVLEDPYKTTPFLPKQKKFINQLDFFIKDSNFDIIQIDFTDNLNLVSLLPQNSKKIFVEIESRYSILNDHVELKKNKTAFDHYVVSNTKDLEITYLRKFDAIFCLSDHEVTRMQNLLSKKQVYSSPFSVPDSNVKQVSMGKSKVNKLIFIGPEYHHPNSDAIYWFIENVYEKMGLKIPLYIIGSWSKESINKFNYNKNVVFTGFVEDFDTYLENSVMIVPIRLGGGGLRTKILIAMAQGAPIISTAIGSDGFDFKHGEDFLLADDATAFYNNIKSLENNTELYFKLAKNAQNLFKTKYSQDYTSRLRNALYHEITKKS